MAPSFVERAMTTTAQADLLDLMVTLRARREPYAVATVVEIAGSASAKPGSKALIAHDGALLAGWVGGGCAESTVRQAALECLGAGEPRVVDSWTWTTRCSARG